MIKDNDWWKKTTIYHIYPRSFMDTTSTGVGDIQGIINKLDYIKSLGVETIWVSPIFLSPGVDHGYDISDYYTIDPLLGTMELVETLITEVHNREMLIIFDMVLNHTSIEHPWFKESRSSIDNPKRDWYIWAKGKKENGILPPNNWLSMIGKRGWTYDKATDEWFYSSYLNFQPDLNYHNPEVKKEMFKIVTFWLEKGVDGFRLDIFNSIMKDPLLSNNPFSTRLIPSPDNNDHGFFQHKKYNFNRPESILLAKELRAVIDKYPNKYLIGEVSGTHSLLRDFIGRGLDGLHQVFLFELLHFRFTKKFFYNFLDSMEKDFPSPYVPSLVYSNHDWGRGLSRVNNNLVKGELLALFQLTARGVPFIYYGDEIGMMNHNIPIIDASDPLSQNLHYLIKKISKILGIFIIRDDARSPMQWNSKDSEHRGFTHKQIIPWLPTLPKSKGRDVETQEKNNNSLLNCYKELLELRKKRVELNSGELRLIDSPKGVLLFERYTNSSSVLIAINFGKKQKTIKLPENYTSIIYKTPNGSATLNNSLLTINGITGTIC